MGRARRWGPCWAGGPVVPGEPGAAPPSQTPSAAPCVSRVACWLLQGPAARQPAPVPGPVCRGDALPAGHGVLPHGESPAARPSACPELLCGREFGPSLQAERTLLSQAPLVPTPWASHSRLKWGLGGLCPTISRRPLCLPVSRAPSRTHSSSPEPDRLPAPPTGPLPGLLAAALAVGRPRDSWAPLELGTVGRSGSWP